MLFPIQCSLSRPLYLMIDMWYHELPDWTETNRYCPETDKDNIKATKLIMGHDIVACEEFYVHNNIVIYMYLERKKTVTRRVISPCIHISVMQPDFLQYGFMLHHTTPHKMY